MDEMMDETLIYLNDDCMMVVYVDILKECEYCYFLLLFEKPVDVAR